MATKKPAGKSGQQPARRPTRQPADRSAGADRLKVVDTTGPRTCKPFVLQVMVFAPDSGFKIEVNIEKSCTLQADAIWKLVFDLYKKKTSGEGFDQLVHVSYTGGTPVEQSGLETTAVKGINSRQADAIVNRVGPAVLDLRNAKDMTPEQLAETKAEVKAASSDVATFALT